MMNLLKSLALAVLFSVGTYAQSQQTCYSIADGSNVLYEFDLTTGTVSGSQALSSCSSPEAATLNLAGDTLFILNADRLHYVPVQSSLSNTAVSGSDISTQQLSGDEGNLYISDFDAMSVDTNNHIWAGTSSNNPCLLAVIDRNGDVVEDYFGSGKDYLVVDNSNYPALRFDAMAFNPITNELYANMNGLSQNYDYLFKINTSTGAMTLVKQLSQMNDVEGMLFDAKGDLYVATGNNSTSSSMRNRLWHVDLTTGFATEQTTLGGTDVEACDCVIGDPIPAVEISGTIFFDKDENGAYGTADFEDNLFEVTLYQDVNTNGTYESGTDTEVATTTTLGDGSYKFRVLYDGSTDYYLVRIDTADLPTGSDFSGNDVIAVTVSNGAVTLEDNNFGYESDILNAFEGFTYADADNDQSFDSWESPVSGVRVRLFEDDNCNGSRDASDAQLDSAIVGQDGKYVFLQPYTAGGSNVCFITMVDESTLPTDASLTTDNIETASFNSGGAADQNNNFGIWGGSVSALPVTWLDFAAREFDSKVILDWSTASEENNSHFIVERSVDAENWEEIGRVNGNGNSVAVSLYEMIDNKPKTGLNYYRIKQVDFDDKFDYSKIIAVDLGIGKIDLVRMTPNPARDYIQLNFVRPLANPSVEVISISGETVMSYRFEGRMNFKRVNLNELKQGMYLLRVSTETETVTKPLVIER